MFNALKAKLSPSVCFNDGCPRPQFGQWKTASWRVYQPRLYWVKNSQRDQEHHFDNSERQK